MLALAAQQEKDPDLAALLTGTFTNEEQNYFEADAEREAPPWISLKIVADAPATQPSQSSKCSLARCRVASSTGRKRYVANFSVRQIDVDGATLFKQIEVD
ncbi:MAG: hypothetical protein AAGM33_05665 [Pseudomonadota bacterium]